MYPEISAPARPRLRRSFRSASLLVAACLTPLAYAAAPFTTYLFDHTSILAVGHDSAGNLYCLTVQDSGPYFVARLPADASRIDYQTRLALTRASAMAVTPSGRLWVGGSVSDGNTFYPAVQSLDPTGATADPVILERTVYADLFALALDPSGALYVTGIAYQPGFPLLPGGFNAPESTTYPGGTFQPYIARVDPAQGRMTATALGVGGGHIAIGPSGDIFVSGNTSSTTYPTTKDAYQTTFTPSFMCSSLCQIAFPSPEQYVTRINPSLATLRYSTFVTGTRGALHQSVAVDATGAAYLTGSTSSSDYPYTSDLAPGDRPGVFLTKLDPTGANLLFSVRQGADLIAFDATGAILAAGSLYPPTGLPYQPGSYPPLPSTGDLPTACLPNGMRVQIAALLQRFDPVTGAPLATRILSATRAQPSALDALPDGRILTAGHSVFPDIPLTPGALYSAAASQSTPYGAYLAAYDLTIPLPALACAADGLTDMPLGPVAPGQLITLFGNFPAASVTFDGIEGSTIYTSPTQINVSVPLALRGTSTLLQIRSGDRYLDSRLLPMAAAVPQLFVDTGGTVQDGNSFFPLIALNPDGGKNSADHPAASGDWITLFLNGAAALSGSNITATMGTITLESETLAPWPGIEIPLNQVRVRVPDITRAGAVPVRLSIGDTLVGPFVYFDKVYQGGGLLWVQ